MVSKRQMLLITFALALAACDKAPPQALGTLEYDRITLPAPAAERIVEISVREGQKVAAGQSLLRLEATRTESARKRSANARPCRNSKPVRAAKPSRRPERRLPRRRRRRATHGRTTPACSRWARAS